MGKIFENKTITFWHFSKYSPLPEAAAWRQAVLRCAAPAPARPR